jgi:hypothetical protein
MLATIQPLVVIGSRQPRAEDHGDAVTYAELMQKFTLRKHQSTLLRWFESAEVALLGSGELRGQYLKAVKDVTLLRCVVFSWVCKVFGVRSANGLS